MQNVLSADPGRQAMSPLETTLGSLYYQPPVLLQGHQMRMGPMGPVIWRPDCLKLDRPHTSSPNRGPSEALWPALHPPLLRASGLSPALRSPASEQCSNLLTGGEEQPALAPSCPRGGWELHSGETTYLEVGAHRIQQAV